MWFDFWELLIINGNEFIYATVVDFHVAIFQVLFLFGFRILGLVLLLNISKHVKLIMRVNAILNVDGIDIEYPTTFFNYEKVWKFIFVGYSIGPGLLWIPGTMEYLVLPVSDRNALVIPLRRSRSFCMDNLGILMDSMDDVVEPKKPSANPTSYQLKIDLTSHSIRILWSVLKCTTHPFLDTFDRSALNSTNECCNEMNWLDNKK